MRVGCCRRRRSKGGAPCVVLSGCSAGGAGLRRGRQAAHLRWTPAHGRNCAADRRRLGGVSAPRGLPALTAAPPGADKTCRIRMIPPWMVNGPPPADANAASAGRIQTPQPGVPIVASGGIPTPGLCPMVKICRLICHDPRRGWAAHRLDAYIYPSGSFGRQVDSNCVHPNGGSKKGDHYLSQLFLFATLGCLKCCGIGHVKRAAGAETAVAAGKARGRRDTGMAPTGKTCRPAGASPGRLTAVLGV